MSALEEPTLTSEAKIVNASRGVGSFLTFDFNRGTQKQKNEDYHLWIYLTDWEITQGSQKLLDSEEESDDLYESVLKKFLGKKLLKFNQRNHHIRFEFEDEFIITLSPDCDFYDDTDALFMFFDRGENIVTSYTVENGLVTEAIEEKGSE